MSRTRVLAEPVADAELARSARTTVDVLDAEDRQRLLEGYRLLAPTELPLLHLTYVEPDRRLVRRLAGLVEEVLRPRLDRLAPRHEPVAAGFVVKAPGSGGEMFLHRDLAVHDERAVATYTMWIPLVDVDGDNGALALVPGSEALTGSAMGITTPLLHEPYAEALRTRLTELPLRAGTGLVYDARVLHASAANRSSVPRPAVVCLLAERGRPLTHVVPTGRHGRRLHRVDPDFFLDVHPQDVATHGLGPSYPVIEDFVDLSHLRPAAVAAAVGLESEPRPAVVVPPDLGLDPANRLEGVDDPSMPDLDPVDRRVSWSTVRMDAPPGVSWEPVDASGRWGSAGDRFVLDAGARVAARRVGGSSTVELRVVESPQVRAGAAVDGAVTQVDRGVRMRVDANRTVLLWNDGPGQLLVQVRPVPRWRRRRGARS